MKKTTVIYHSGDYDGIFCREIARQHYGDVAEYIGWNFGDPPLMTLPGLDGLGNVVVLDLPVDQPFGFNFRDIKRGQSWKDFLGQETDLTWIDHHASSIASHPKNIPGYRIDGVAACRLAWQWFNNDTARNVMGDVNYLPEKSEYLKRSVREPVSVQLAGEYDIWDHRGDGDLEFQFGLDCQHQISWLELLKDNPAGAFYTSQILEEGRAAMRCYAKRDADIMRERSFLVEWEGLKFLALNTARCNSNTYAARDLPATGHDALMAFFFNGRAWTVSLYHANHRKDIDLSLIAVKHGGGGHRGACGFTCKSPPFLTAI